MTKKIVLIAIIVILLFLHTVFEILDAPNNFLMNKTSFINSFFYKSAVNLKNLYENYKNLHQTAKKNQELKQQIEKLTAQIAEVQFLKQENKSLKKTLNFLKEKEYKYISGRVFVQNFDSANRILMVDKGTNDGIKKNLPVITENGILIGVIEAAKPTYSLIKLLSDNRSQVSVMIQNDSNSLGLLKGGFDLGMRVELVPQSEKVEEGNLVVSSSLNKNIPANLLVGYAESVKNNPHEPFQTIFIKSATDYSKITTVTIILYAQ